jgi:hypothetical protein
MQLRDKFNFRYNRNPFTSHRTGLSRCNALELNLGCPRFEYRDSNPIRQLTLPSKYYL